MVIESMLFGSDNPLWKSRVIVCWLLVQKASLALSSQVLEVVVIPLKYYLEKYSSCWNSEWGIYKRGRRFFLVWLFLFQFRNCQVKEMWAAMKWKRSRPAAFLRQLTQFQSNFRAVTEQFCYHVPSKSFRANLNSLQQFPVEESQESQDIDLINANWQNVIGLKRLSAIIRLLADW